MIIVLEGLHNFVEFDTKQESEIKFWLPKTFPKRIRVIVTTSSSSKSYNYLQRLGSTIVNIDKNSITHNDAIADLKSKNSLMDPEYVDQFVATLIEKVEADFLDRTSVKSLALSFCPYETKNILERADVDVEAVKKILSGIDYDELWAPIHHYKQVLELIIEFFEDKITKPERYREVMIFLSLTFKGLTKKELFNLTGVTDREWSLFLAFFKPYFFTFKGFWNISNELFKHIIFNKYLGMKQDQQGASTSVAIEYHRRIGNEMNNTPNSIRKLEEQTINYFMSNEYSLLKQTISDIENFLLLFNPYTKYDLCRYWQALEKKGYDPVIEYNKRLESFELHFEPRPEDLFIIILQISRFFKEFADFETKTTPKFRHPFIKGKVMQTKLRADEIEEESKIKQAQVHISHFLRRGAGRSLQDKEHTAAEEDELAERSKKDEAPCGVTAPIALGEDWVFNEDESSEENMQEENNPQMATMNAGNQESGEEKLGPGIIDFLRSIGLESEIKKMQMTETYLRMEPRTNKLRELKNVPITAKESLNVDIPKKKQEFMCRFEKEIADRKTKRALLDPKVLDDIFAPKPETELAL